MRAGFSWYMCDVTSLSQLLEVEAYNNYYTCSYIYMKIIIIIVIIVYIILKW